MSNAILKWLGGDDTGLSSKAIALSALGEMPNGAVHKYPHDGSDYGRCHRLLQAAPEAKAGLEKLAKDGGPYWAALAARWDEIQAAYLRDLDRASGHRDETRALMRSILRPIEDADSSIIRLGDGVSLRFGA